MANYVSSHLVGLSYNKNDDYPPPIYQRCIGLGSHTIDLSGVCHTLQHNFVRQIQRW